MKVSYLEGQHNVDQFSSAVSEFESDTSINSLLIFTAANTQIEKAKYDPILTKSRLSIMGGIYPEILYQGKNYKEGTIILGIKESTKNLIIENESELANLSDNVEHQFGGIDPKDHSVFIFMDALIGEKSNIFDALYNEFGTAPRYVGAGAGSLAFNSFPCVYSNKGMIQSGAVIGLSAVSSNVGVAHGWDDISEPLKVTEATGNKIVSLNWKPAMEVYQSVVESHSGKRFDYNDFYNSTKSYPFGISKLDAQKVVRDPFKHEDGVIFTLDHIDQGSHVTILYGNKESLLDGASEARKRALPSNSTDKQIVLIDCISRVLFLNEDFKTEMNNLDPNNEAIGALTLGEIANSGDSYLEVYNKTAVVCALNG